MLDQSVAYVTAKDGAGCKVQGDDKAVAAVIRALKREGAKWNAQVETWDFGFYKN